MPVLAVEVSQWLIGLMVVFFLFISLCMMLIVLIQRPQGGGISGAFGGGGAEGAGQTAFGAKTGDVLTTVTIGIFVVFLGSAIALNYLVRPPKGAPEPTIGAPPEPPVPVTSAPAPTPAPAPVTAEAPQPAGGTPDGDGKFKADSGRGSVESVVPIEIIPAGQPIPADAVDIESVINPPKPATNPPATTPPATNPPTSPPATNPPANPPATPPAKPPANPPAKPK